MLNPVAFTSGPFGAQDWDALFQAVTARLSTSAEPGYALPDTAHTRQWLRKQVLDCVEALTLLHAQVGQERDTQLRTVQALANAEAALASAHQELAARRASERRALHLAHHDGLTQLPNRSHFQQRLGDALQPPPSLSGISAQRPALAVMYLDLDGLKPINDQHGHHAGDQLLRIVAARLSRAVRREDTVCRMGGDEFACLLTQVISREQLSHLACKLFDAVSAPLKIGDLELTVRPSIGIALCPGDGATADGLLRNADSAMYHAKRRQLGYAFFDATHGDVPPGPHARPRNNAITPPSSV